MLQLVYLNLCTLSSPINLMSLTSNQLLPMGTLGTAIDLIMICCLLGSNASDINNCLFISFAT